MITQDETTFRESQNKTQAAAAMPAEEATEKKTNVRWQTVTIGGVAGIAMGAAATHTVEALAADADEAVELVEEDDTLDATSPETEGATVTEVHQATVNQNLSFGEAFAAARAEVGAGGVFIWHGQLYNTYTADEWQAMNDAQRDEFAGEVQPYLGQQMAEDHHTTASNDTETSDSDSNVHQTSHTDNVTAEPQVHFLGVETREVEGQTINVGRMSIDDVQVALVDVDNDQVFDVRVMDTNQNGEIEDNEVSDISRIGMDVETFQTLSELDQMQQETQPEQANHVQEDLAPDMPDYMNDADVDLA
ncbi:MAG: hypothetical protein J5545_13435 [Bacteroidaceae bacterium]|nr:hypothetical protein [Bacteroidaceae bacterium]